MKQNRIFPPKQFLRLVRLATPPVAAVAVHLLRILTTSSSEAGLGPLAAQGARHLLDQVLSRRRVQCLTKPKTHRDGRLQRERVSRFECYQPRGCSALVPHR